jgi:rhodanese-related sulfurtransferase
MLLNKLRTFVKNTESDWNYITPVDFYNEYYIKKKDFFLIDLRKKQDFDEFHIKGATNIFWLDLLNDESLNILPKNKKIFLICYLGHTSSQALVLLKLLGYDVTSIKFGYGKSPVFGVPVAGWLNYNFPVTKKCNF